MQTLNLSICGSDRTHASFDDVMAVQTPQKTDTWTPISHGFLIEETKKKLDENGFDIINENHNLARLVSVTSGSCKSKIVVRQKIQIVQLL